MVSRRARANRSVAVLIAAAVTVLATGNGCTEKAKSSEIGDAPRSPSYGGTFSLMLEAPGSLDPALVDDVYEACIINQLYDGLLEFDHNLKPIPAIAREWSISRDGREYRFVLRDDVRFHNGRVVTAKDFVYTFTRIFDPVRSDYGIGGEYLQKIVGVREYFGGSADSISGIAAENDSTLVIRLDAPYGSFLSVLAMDQTKVVAREEVERWGDEYSLHPVGTGPFRFRERVDDPERPHLVLEANPDHFRGRPYLDEVVFHVPKDFNVDRGVEALLAGQVSLCDMPGAVQSRFEEDPAFFILRRPELSFSFIGLNVNDGPVDDARVRRAVAHAVNRAEIMAVDPVGRIPAVGILPPGMFGYSPAEKALPHAPEEARRLLAEAGYPGGEGLSPLNYWQADRGEVGRQADRVLATSLAEVGIDLRFRYVEWEEFEPLLDGREIPAFGLTWVGDVPDPDSFLASLFMSTGVYNLFEYSNPLVDSLLAVGAEMRGSRARASVYRQAEKIILDDVPVIPLFHLVNNFAVRAEVQGLVVTPFGLGNLPIERVWIDAPAS